MSTLEELRSELEQAQRLNEAEIQEMERLETEVDAAEARQRLRRMLDAENAKLSLRRSQNREFENRIRAINDDEAGRYLHHASGSVGTSEPTSPRRKENGVLATIENHRSNIEVRRHRERTHRLRVYD